MRVALALVLNVLLALGLAKWLRHAYRRAAVDPAGRSLRRWLLPTLVLRLVAGVLVNGPDAQRMNFLGRAYTAQFWAHPGAGWAIWQSHQLREGQKIRVLYEWSNTLFTSKILGLLNFASLGAGWLNGLYLSAGCFAACWILVRTLARLFPAAPAGAGVVAFLLWPSVVWWTAGLTKETLLLSSGAALATLVLGWLYGPARRAQAPEAAPQLRAPRARRWGQYVAGGLLAGGLVWLHLRLRYFFALPLVGSLLALGGVGLASWRGWLPTRRLAQAVALLAGLALGAGLVAASGNVLVSRDFIISQLWANYTHGLATSPGRPHLEYAQLQPTGRSLLRHAPRAATATLTRPWLGESAAPRYFAAGLENLLLLGLLGLAAVAVARGRPGHLPLALVLALLVYCWLLAALIGLSTPNLGTLHRYRAVFLPWLLWLLLQNDYARRLLQAIGLRG